MKPKGLVFRLSIYIISLVSLILCGLLIINYQTTKRIMMQNIEANISTVFQKSFNDIIRRVDILQNITQRYSFVLMQRRQLDDSEAITFLSSVAKQDTLILGTSIVYQPELDSKSRDLFFHYSSINDSSLILKYDRIKNNNLLLKSNGKWSDPYYHDIYKSYVSSYSLPFYHDNQGNITISGFLKIDIQIKWLNDIVSNMKVYEKGRVFLITQHGQFITHPKKELIVNENFLDLANSYKSKELISILDSIKLLKSGYIVVPDIFNNSEHSIFAYNLLFENGWYIISQFSVSEHLKELKLITRGVLFYGIIGLFLIFGVCYYIINSITKPIRQLTILTEEIRNGNFNVFVPSSDKQDEAGKLTTSIIAMQVELKKYIQNLTKTIREKEMIENDIRIASVIQANMLPSSFPSPDEINGIDIYGKIIPAEVVSGDLYDYRVIDENKMYFLIGDVAGKSVAASLFMAMTRALVIAESKRESKPEKIFDAVNNQLCENNNESIFVTAIIGMLDLNTDELSYCNAGHNYPYLISKSGELAILEETHGLPLGLFPDQKYKTSKIKLSEGSYLFTYSDGVTEAENEEKVQFSEKRLEILLLNPSWNKLSSKRMALNVLEEIDAHVGDIPKSDDITIFIVSNQDGRLL